MRKREVERKGVWSRLSGTSFTIITTTTGGGGVTVGTGVNLARKNVRAAVRISVGKVTMGEGVTVVVIVGVEEVVGVAVEEIMEEGMTVEEATSEC